MIEETIVLKLSSVIEYKMKSDPHWIPKKHEISEEIASQICLLDFKKVVASY